MTILFIDEQPEIEGLDPEDVELINKFHATPLFLRDLYRYKKRVVNKFGFDYNEFLIAFNFKDGKYPEIVRKTALYWVNLSEDEKQNEEVKNAIFTKDIKYSPEQLERIGLEEKKLKDKFNSFPKKLANLFFENGFDKNGQPINEFAELLELLERSTKVKKEQLAVTDVYLLIELMFRVAYRPKVALNENFIISKIANGLKKFIPTLSTISQIIENLTILKNEGKS